MKAHRSLSRQDVLRYPPDKISLMVASEFYRASSRCHNRSNVVGCYERARELMGLLETLPLAESICEQLGPVYKMCTENQLFSDDHLKPDYVKRFGEELAEKFTWAADRIAHA